MTKPSSTAARASIARQCLASGANPIVDRKLAARGEWGRTPILEVVMRPPEVFVRSLSHQEAVKLKRMSTRAEHQATRIQDNRSAKWTADIRVYAAANRIELVPTPTYASYVNRSGSHFCPIQEFVFNNTDHPDWATAQRALADYITHRNGRDHDRWIAALERKHRVAA